MKKAINFIFTLNIFILLTANILAQSWVQVAPVTNPGIRPSISVASINDVWIVDGTSGAPKIFKSVDGGTSWQPVQTAGIDQELYCVWAMSGNLVYVGEGEVNGNADLLRTTNGGANWTVVFSTPPNRGYFNGLAFTKANGNIFGLSIAERVYRSVNNGNNWIELNPGVNGVSNAQNSLMIVDNDFYGFGLNNGSARVRLTTDNSSSWSTQTLSVSGNYTSAIGFHSNKLLGLAATSTSPPMVSRTTDGGLSWTSVDIGSGISGACYLNWIPNTPVVYILGSNGGVKRSTNSGLTWVLTPTPGVTNLTHFDFYQAGMVVYGYAVSSNGNVIKLVDTLNILTGVTGNNNIPSKYSLEQNYPNPFNPVTSISYSIPEQGHVRLGVFDALGREVDVIVNEIRQAGNYEESWDASGFNSGVYFYRINSGEFTQTKKMILIK